VTIWISYAGAGQSAADDQALIVQPMGGHYSYMTMTLSQVFRRQHSKADIVMKGRSSAVVTCPVGYRTMSVTPVWMT
jgi:hypothetical protein